MTRPPSFHRTARRSLIRTATLSLPSGSDRDTIMPDKKFDPIQIEILKNALTSIADEMALTVLRTGHSTIIKDGADFSTALCDAKGELLIQGLTIPQHLGSIPDALAALIRHFPKLDPGDIVIQNDPFDGGM